MPIARSRKHSWQEFRALVNEAIARAEAGECDGCRLLRLRLHPAPEASLTALVEAAEPPDRDRPLDI